MPDLGVSLNAMSSSRVSFSQQATTRAYQRFLHERNRGKKDCDGRPDREPEEIARWAREHELPYDDGHVRFPDTRVEYEDRDGRGRWPSNLIVGLRSAAPLFFKEDFQLGDRVKVPGPARGAFQCNQLRQRDTAARDAERLYLNRVRQQILIRAASCDFAK